MARVTVFLFLFVSVISGKGKVTFDEVDKEIIYYTYNFQFEKAQSLLDPLLIKEPDNLKYYFLSLGVKSMIIEKSVFEEKPETRRELKRKLNEETIKYANSILERFENYNNTTENKFYMGCIYGYLGRMYGVTGSWMSAFSDGKSGRNLLEEVVEESPDFNDAYLLLGMFNYYADRMGGFLGFVAGILGLSGDRETGLEYILKTYKGGELLSDQAALLLIELYSSLEGNGFRALDFHRKFVKKYPNNIQMQNWYVRDLLRYELLSEALEYIKTVNGQYIDPYLKAQLFHKAGDYQLSNQYADEAEKRIDYYYNGMREYLKYLKAANNWMLGNSSYENLAGELNEEYSEYFDQLTKEPVLAKKILKFGSEAGKSSLSEESKTFFNNAPEFENQFLDVLYAYYAGVYLYKNKNFNEARKKFERVEYFDRKNYHFRAVQYLIDIYGKIEVQKTKVEILLEKIEEMEYENLSFWAKDLEKTYQLD